MNNLDEYKLATPPENNEPKEKGKCDMCLEPFEYEDLFSHFQNLVPYQCCSDCLHNLHSDLNLKIK